MRYDTIQSACIAWKCETKAYVQNAILFPFISILPSFSAASHVGNVPFQSRQYGIGSAHQQQEENNLYGDLKVYKNCCREVNEISHYRYCSWSKVVDESLSSGVLLKKWVSSFERIAWWKWAFGLDVFHMPEKGELHYQRSTYTPKSQNLAFFRSKQSRNHSEIWKNIEDKANKCI